MQASIFRIPPISMTDCCFFEKQRATVPDMTKTQKLMAMEILRSLFYPAAYIYPSS